ncbi:MAG: hypothetical protein GKC08_05750 [Methanosarcinales archaeon]|nr:hypothetical protein [Methanosarcinales archaeon]
MKSDRIGLMIFWLSALYMFVAGWLANWWVAPIYRNVPIEEVNQTVLAVGGPLFIILVLSIPLGATMAAIGILLYAEKEISSIWPVAIAGGFILLISMLFPTMGYYPIVFGALAGFILLSFIAILWYWGKRRVTLKGPARTAADFQLIGYLFFIMAAGNTCVILGNPFWGLYFPEKVLETDALPIAYSFGIKLIIYFTLGWLFIFLSHYKAAQVAEKQK